MPKLKLSWTGGNPIETWHITQQADVGEPHLTIERHGRELKILFENDRERDRFAKGVTMCRAKFEEEGFVREVYLTGFKG